MVHLHVAAMQIHQQLLSLQAQLEGAIRTAKLSAKVKRWVQVSALRPCSHLLF